MTLSAGGMGEVWKARGAAWGAIASLQHPNICALYDVGSDFLVMEYIEGECQGTRKWHSRRKRATRE